MLRREDEKRIKERLFPVEPVLISGLTPYMEKLLYNIEERGGTRHNNKLLSLEGEIDPFYLERRLKTLSERHEILRTTYIYDKLSRGRLVVLPRVTIPLSFTSLIGFSKSAQEERIRDFILNRPKIDFLKDSLFGVDIFQISGKRSQVLISYLELSLDFPSLVYIVEELLHSREPGGSPRPFSVFISQLETRGSKDGGKFFKEAFGGIRRVSSLSVPASGSMDTLSEKDYGEDEPYRFHMEEGLFKKLKALGRDARLSLPALSESAFGIALSLYGSPRVQAFLQIAPVRGALSGDLKLTAGELLVLSPTKTEISPNKSFLEISSSQERFNFEAAPYGYTPLSEIKRSLGLDIGDIVFKAEEESRYGPRSLKVTLEPSFIIRESHSDFLFHFEWDESSAWVTIHANPKRFGKKLVEEFAQSFFGLLGVLTLNPRTPVGELKLLAQPLKKRILSYSFKESAKKESSGKDIPKGPLGVPLISPDSGARGAPLSGDARGSHSFLEEILSRALDGGRAPAVAGPRPSDNLNREELISLSRGIASKLLKAASQSVSAASSSSKASSGEPGPDLTVGALAPLGPALGVAALGTLMAGASFVPMDPAWKKERLLFVLKDAGVAGLLFQESDRKLAEELLAAHSREEGERTFFLSVFSTGEGSSSGRSPEEGRDAIPPALFDPERVLFKLYKGCFKEDQNIPYEIERPGISLTGKGASGRVFLAKDALDYREGGGVLYCGKMGYSGLFSEILAPWASGAYIVDAGELNYPGRDLDKLSLLIKEKTVSHAFLRAREGKIFLSRERKLLLLNESKEPVNKLKALVLLGSSRPPGRAAGRPGQSGQAGQAGSPGQSASGGADNQGDIHSEDWPIIVPREGDPFGIYYGNSIVGGFSFLGKAPMDKPLAFGGKVPEDLYALILNSWGESAPPGATGEICLGGPVAGIPVAMDPREEPTEPFLKNPYASKFNRDHKYLIRTGRFGYYDLEGTLRFLGTSPEPSGAGSSYLKGRFISLEAISERLGILLSDIDFHLSLERLKDGGEYIRMWIWGVENSPELRLKVSDRIREASELTLPVFLYPTVKTFLDAPPITNGSLDPKKLKAKKSEGPPGDPAALGTLRYKEALETISAVLMEVAGLELSPGINFASLSICEETAFLCAKNLSARGFPSEGKDFFLSSGPEDLALLIFRRQQKMDLKGRVVSPSEKEAAPGAGAPGAAGAGSPHSPEAGA
jgi:hypothetical protein